jgi:hypothetical protein
MTSKGTAEVKASGRYKHADSYVLLLRMPPLLLLLLSQADDHQGYG